jgi:hypothetical protein
MASARRRIVTNKELDAAARRGRDEVAQSGASSIRYSGRRDELVIELNTAVVVRIPRNRAPSLAGATVRDFATLELSPMGTSFTVRSLDLDYSISGLLRKVLNFNEQQRAAGAKSTPAKRAAAAANGKRGGRPRKKIG